MKSTVKIYVEYDGFSIELRDDYITIGQEDNPGPPLKYVFEQLGIDAEYEVVT